MSDVLRDSSEFGPDHPLHDTIEQAKAERALSKESAQAFIERFLDGATRKASEQALSDLSDLPDEVRQNISDLLAERLPSEPDHRKRAWTVSALAEINAPSAVDVVGQRLDPNAECGEWVRYWAAIGLAGMQCDRDELRRRLEAALGDESPLVKAVSLRLLIENGQEQYVDPLLQMAQDPEWLNRMAAAKALRSNAGHKAFRESVEIRLIPVLVARLYDSYEVPDCQYQVARALGSIKHRWLDSVTHLGEVLKRDVPSRVARACVDALNEINRPEIKEALLVALQDDDAEIRVQAARALDRVLTTTGALDFIVSDLLQQEAPTPYHLDALRAIDRTAAAAALSKQLFHPDPKLATRAERALARLGGEEAVRALQAQQAQALDKYSEVLKQADDRITAQFDRLIQQARLGFTMSMWMHGIIFGVGVVVLIASLFVALSRGFDTFERYLGLGTAAGSLGTLLLLFYKNPLQNIRGSVTNLVKINVVFLGYVRQINQIDATFKQMYIASVGFGVDQMKQTVAQIQDSVDKTMEEVGAYLEDDRSLRR